LLTLSKRSLALACALLAAACTNTGSADRFLTKYADPDPSLEAVLVCHGYGCKRQDTVDLRLAWPRLVAVMAEPAPDAATERANIAVTIAAFEAEVGAMLGTSEDVGGTFEGFAMPGQLDCIDETSNTTTVLELLAGAGLLVWHEVRGPMSRFFVYDGWPHTTAVIVETASGEAFAVDSWFHDNGQPAEIVPLEMWVAGWGPEGATAVAAAPAAGTQEIASAGTETVVEQPSLTESAEAAAQAETAAIVTEDEQPVDATEPESTPVEEAAPLAAKTTTTMAMAPVVSEGDPMAEETAAPSANP
jgi:hypothetical protein